MLKTRQKLERLREEFAWTQRKEENRKLARRKRKKADQQRARNKRKAHERANQERMVVARQKSEAPAPINPLGCPWRDDPREQKRASKRRCSFDIGAGPEPRTLAQWCEYISQEIGFQMTPADLWHLMTEERVGGIGEVIRLVRSVSLR